jgi:hypothetical protein
MPARVPDEPVPPVDWIGGKSGVSLVRVLLPVRHLAPNSLRREASGRGLGGNTAPFHGVPSGL